MSPLTPLSCCPIHFLAVPFAPRNLCSASHWFPIPARLCVCLLQLLLLVYHFIFKLFQLLLLLFVPRDRLLPSGGVRAQQ